MKKRKRTSIVSQYTTNEFASLIKNHKSFADIIRTLGLQQTGGNYKTLQERIREDNINIEHITLNNNKFTQAANLKNTIPLEQILVEHSTYKGGDHLKKRLLNAGLLENKCSKCELPPTWNNMPLVLQLDHINGVNDDNRIKNLRLLCPNCHTQTETFCGKHNKSIKRKCIDCKQAIYKKSLRCVQCNNTSRSISTG